MTAKKYDNEKPMMDLIEPEFLIKMAEVLTFGANKYGRENWKENGGLAPHRLYAAGQRHLNTYWSGEKMDSESGMSHLAHAACCIMMLMCHPGEKWAEEKAAEEAMKKTDFRALHTAFIEKMTDDDDCAGEINCIDWYVPRSK